MLKEQLIALRKEHKKTQEEIAKILGITRPAYTAYESGNRQPDYDSLLKLAKFYNVSVDYLLTGIKDDEEKGNLFFFDMDGLTEDEIDDIKRHIEYVKWKAKEERGK
ncbi:helix-turn-helix transcriptional regulator [Bacillus sp. Bva_UNVM-123]|uniref:helix-turn-helix domain-containing protein n=1 Tax=Bacillus sp. Bva_UNVM-123 TaxID=2829798 RepID=UPI00391F9FDA